MKYLVVFERTPTSVGAYVPDLPGCVAVGKTREDVVQLIEEAVEMHLAGMREDNLPIPEPSADTGFVEVA
jgi:predicted RNase H-like HicB family nuclease